MGSLKLDQLGIQSPQDIIRNPSYDLLFQHETDPALTGLEKGVVTDLGAVNVDTGKFTGRSPQDKYFVEEASSAGNLWWHNSANPKSNNKPLSQETWEHLRQICARQLSGKRLYIIDGFAGANPETRLKVRIISEVAWQAHFCKNMFIQPSDAELDGFKPDWTILNACKTSCDDPQKWGLRSPVFAANHIGERMSLIGGTWYGGEMKKGIFTIMNYFLPLQGVGSFHCSANMGSKGDTALFFGLSGTGKTTLSTDPHRRLIGDDEHGWDNDGVFNFEGGCYAKTINLSPEKEPQIYRAIKRNALLENCVLRDDGSVDFASSKKTENTRVSYPIHHIDNVVDALKGTHPSNVIFLTADAFAVLPPVARLSQEQAMYQYLSGYTAKVAGTELGVTEPSATFSACYGAAFLAVHPTLYADILGRKMTEHGTRAYLVNTGWVGGPYGVGSRMDITQTRAIIDAILDGSLDRAEFETMPLFNLQIPKSLPGVDTRLLNPRNAWADQEAYDAQARKLATMFVNNFQQFTGTDNGKKLVQAGPQLDTVVA